MSNSVWRRVRARVHLSLTPAELSNPVRAATNRAFSSLLMRFNPELGGAVVAHIGPVHLSAPPSFVGASPFPHVVAIANLLVFAPIPGAELLGVVTHVGPDHLGLSVLSAFHAVLPIDDLSHMYQFDTDYNTPTPTPTWRHINGQEKITVNRQIRFVVSDLKPTRTGLFQIIASLDHTLREQSNDCHPLGLLPLEKQISLFVHSTQTQPNSDEPENADLPEINRRNTVAPETYNLTGDDLLTSGNGGFGDALIPIAMPMPTPVSALKRKERTHDDGTRASVRFGESGQDTRQKGITKDSHATESRHVVSTPKIPRKKDRSEKDDARETPGSQVDDKSERRKRKKEKRKKKQKRMSGNVEKTWTSEHGEREKDKQDSSIRVNKEVEITRSENDSINKAGHMVKQEKRTVEGDITLGDSALNGADTVRSARKDNKKRKKKKNKGKEIDDSGDAEAQLQRGLVVNGKGSHGPEKGDREGDGRRDIVRKDNGRIIKHEDRPMSGDETGVKKEMVVDARPITDEISAEDDKEVVRTSERREKHRKRKHDDNDDHRKVKKKRKRSSEGEIDSEMKRKKKKRKKRLSMRMENE